MKAILAVCVAVLFLACSPVSQDTHGKDSQANTQGRILLTDPAKPIEVKKGETFSIHLASNPTTGFKWQLAGQLDSSILIQAGHEFLRPSSMFVGAGGKEIWTFKAVAGGKTVIEMEYVRPWEKQTVPTGKASFRIIVLDQ